MLLIEIPVCSEISPFKKSIISSLQILFLVAGSILLTSWDRGVFPSLHVPVLNGLTKDFLVKIDCGPCGTKFSVSSVNCLIHSNLLIFPDVVLLMVLGLTNFTEAMLTPCSSATSLDFINHIFANWFTIPYFSNHNQANLISTIWNRNPLC